jgi:hypothetical protein
MKQWERIYMNNKMEPRKQHRGTERDTARCGSIHLLPPDGTDCVTREMHLSNQSIRYRQVVLAA